MSATETETRTSPSLVRVVEIEGRGRSLVASQPLRAGQIALRDSPILVYSALPLISQTNCPNYYCDNCFRKLPAPQTCSSSSSLASLSVASCPLCSLHIFCSPNCLSVALASSHSPWFCQALIRLRDCPSLAIDQPLERQLQARFLIAAYNLAHVSPSDFQILLSLQGQGSPAPADAAAAQFLHALIFSLCPPPAPPLPEQGFSVELTAALLAKDKLNAFGLMEPFDDGQRSVRAYGIYPKASFFNHDCLPNACRFDYVDTAPDHNRNTDIIIRMIHDVPEGREICLSYFPVNENYSSRQKRLVEDYGFACTCDRCKVEANWSDDDDQEEEDAEVMDEDLDEHMAASSSASDTEHDAPAPGETDFPHAYFFLRYMCSRENCWGTLAPLPPSDASPSHVMECNVCSNLKTDGGEDNLYMDDATGDQMMQYK